MWVQMIEEKGEKSKQSLAFLYSLLLAAVLSSISPLLLSINTMIHEDLVLPRAKHWARRNASWFSRVTGILL